jgi:hypothetical protein
LKTSEPKKVAAIGIDAAQSISRNISEGYCRRSLKEYLNHGEYEGDIVTESALKNIDKNSNNDMAINMFSTFMLTHRKHNFIHFL